MAKKKAKPIGDLNGQQWNAVEAWAISALRNGKLGTDRELAAQALNYLFGKEGEDGMEPPPRGYSSDLVDGVTRMVEVRRRQVVSP